MKRLPWRIYRYIGRELAIIFVVGLSALTLLYMIVIGLKGVSTDLPLGIVAAVAFDSIGFSFFFTVPIALMLAGTLTYGRMVSDREYTAITAAGMSPLQLLVPMAGLCALVGALAFWTHGTVLPDAHFAQRDIARHLIQQIGNLGDRFDGNLPIDEDGGQVRFDEVREGRFLSGIHIRKKLPRSGFVFDTENATAEQVPAPSDGVGAAEEKPPETPVEMLLFAQRAVLEVDPETKRIVMTLFQVDLKLGEKQKALFDQQGTPWVWNSVRMSSYQVEFNPPKTERRRADLHNPDLQAEIDEMITTNEERRAQLASLTDATEREEQSKVVDYFDQRIRKYKAEYWQRKALALSVISFGFLGFPVSLVFRYRHRLTSVFLGALLLITVFYPLLLLGETLCVQFSLPPALSMLLGNIALLAISLGLTGRLLLR